MVCTRQLEFVFT